LHAEYVKYTIQIETGGLDSISELAKKHKITVYLGIIKRTKNRGEHSIYVALVYINKVGKIKSVHRKLQPTYHESLIWSPGDGNGLQVYNLNNLQLVVLIAVKIGYHCQEQHYMA